MPFHFDDESTPPPQQMNSPVLCVRTQVRIADLTVKGGPHRFGGLLALDVRGAPQEKPPLHRVVTLSLADPLVGIEMEGITELPLVYGFVFDGCRMKYRVVSNEVIEILELDPDEPSDDWPYPPFPSEFPSKPFAWVDGGTIDPERVESLSWQGFEGVDDGFDPQKSVALIVPECADYGVSLWGGDGDDGLIQVIFEIDPKKRIVSAKNACT